MHESRQGNDVSVAGAGRRSGEVLPPAIRDHSRMAPRQEYARTGSHPRTGKSVYSAEATEDIIDRLPRPARLAVYAIFALTFTGIIPTLSCAALEAACDALGWWLLIPIYTLLFVLVKRILVP